MPEGCSGIWALDGSSWADDPNMLDKQFNGTDKLRLWQNDEKTWPFLKIMLNERFPLASSIEEVQSLAPLREADSNSKYGNTF